MRVRVVHVFLAVFFICMPSAYGADDDFILQDAPSVKSYSHWSTGYIYAFGSGQVPDAELRLAGQWNMNLKAAWSDARRRLADHAGFLAYDAARQVRKIVGDEGSLQAQKAFRNFFQGAEPVRIYKRPDGSSGLWIRAPLYGLGGLAAVLDRRVQENGGTPNSFAEELRGPFLTIAVTSNPSIEAHSLWPKIISHDGDVFADLASLSEGGLLPPRFWIYRISGDDLQRSPLFSTIDLAGALRSTVHENKTDFILEDIPGHDEKFNPYAYKGILFVHVPDEESPAVQMFP